jgi:hypothetical protein
MQKVASGGSLYSADSVVCAVQENIIAEHVESFYFCMQDFEVNLDLNSI